MKVSTFAAAVGGMAFLIATPAPGQQARFFYPSPAPGAVTVTTNVAFATADTTVLAMDVYRPANSRTAAPALILFATGNGPHRRMIYPSFAGTCRSFLFEPGWIDRA